METSHHQTFTHRCFIIGIAAAGAVAGDLWQWPATPLSARPLSPAVLTSKHLEFAVEPLAAAATARPW